MKTYIYDGSLCGFYTAVFNAYLDKELDSMIIARINKIQLIFNEKIKLVESDEDKAKRVQAKLLQICGNIIFEDINYVFASSDIQKDTIIFKYIQLILEIGSLARKYLSNDDIINFNNLRHKVALECHRMKGFIHFKETISDIYYAPYKPDNNITSLILPHFINRFSSMPFLIHDVERNIVGLYNTKIFKVIRLKEKLTVYLSEKESEFNLLWKTYFESVNIASRKNTKLQDNYMPKRYREFM